jgi:hypothetical protein
MCGYIVVHRILYKIRKNCYFINILWDSMFVKQTILKETNRSLFLRINVKIRLEATFHSVVGKIMITI